MGALSCDPPALQETEARAAHGVRSLGTLQEPLLVERGHPAAAGVILHRPETHDHGPRAGDPKRAPQTYHSLTGRDLSDTAVAGGEDDPLRAREVQRADLLRREDAVLFRR